VSGNSRLDALHAAILQVKLDMLDDWTAKRRAHAAAYREALQGRVRLPPPDPPHGRAVYNMFVIRHAERDRLIRELAAQGIGSRIHYPIPIHRQPAFAGFQTEQLEHTERACSEIMSIPIGPELSERDRDRVIEALTALT
jgi:dTDP-4-amino-4,6-dideoxygalactose transaminase